MSGKEFVFNFNGPVGQNIANVERMDVHMDKDAQIQVMNAEKMESMPPNQVVDEKTEEHSEQQQGDTSKTRHVKFFVAAMKKMQREKYNEAPPETNIKHVYDWYAVYRMAKDIGLISNFDEFLQIMQGEDWFQKPKAIQNFSNYDGSIADNTRYPNWQCKTRTKEKYFHKFLHIAQITYSLYKIKCKEANIIPFA